jgi:hypothetical protein
LLHSGQNKAEKIRKPCSITHLPEAATMRFIIRFNSAFTTKNNIQNFTEKYLPSILKEKAHKKYLNRHFS